MPVTCFCNEHMQETTATFSPSHLGQCGRKLFDQNLQNMLQIIAYLAITVYVLLSLFTLFLLCQSSVLGSESSSLVFNISVTWTVSPPSGPAFLCVWLVKRKTRGWDFLCWMERKNICIKEDEGQTFSCVCLCVGLKSSSVCFSPSKFCRAQWAACILSMKGAI